VSLLLSSQLFRLCKRYFPFAKISANGIVSSDDLLLHAWWPLAEYRVLWDRWGGVCVHGSDGSGPLGVRTHTLPTLSVVRA
jgi:hypothetical protein